MTDADVTAIADGELPDLLGALRTKSTAILAVSGGCDSMALMLLVARWRSLVSAISPQPEIVVATVDHGLRPESAAEALFVAEHAARLGFQHRTLVWQGDKPVTGIQEAARIARYGLLRQLADELGGDAACTIVTAHHRGDLVETFLMRLARGSGIDGLVGMAGHPRDDIVHFTSPVFRPLLGQPKQRLQATLAAAGWPYVEDPSNDNAAFERVRLRQAQPVLDGLGLGEANLALSVRRLARAREVLTSFSAAAYKRLVDDHDGAFAHVNLPELAAGHAEIGIRVLQRCLKGHGGRGCEPPLSDVEDLWGRIVSGGFRGQTLADCLIDVAADGLRLVVCREPGRGGVPSVALPSDGSPVLWDNRFVIAAPGVAPDAGLAGLEVRPLASGLFSIDPDVRKSSGMPRAALATLPSIWRGEALIAVPHLLLPAVAPEISDADVRRPTVVATSLWVRSRLR